MVRSGKPGSFIAGADVNAIAAFAESGDRRAGSEAVRRGAGPLRTHRRAPRPHRGGHPGHLPGRRHRGRPRVRLPGERRRRPYPDRPPRGATRDLPRVGRHDATSPPGRPARRPRAHAHREGGAGLEGEAHRAGGPGLPLAAVRGAEPCVRARAGGRECAGAHLTRRIAARRITAGQSGAQREDRDGAATAEARARGPHPRRDSPRARACPAGRAEAGPQAHRGPLPRPVEAPGSRPQERGADDRTGPGAGSRGRGRVAGIAGVREPALPLSAPGGSPQGAVVGRRPRGARGADGGDRSRADGGRHRPAGGVQRHPRADEGHSPRGRGGRPRPCALALRRRREAQDTPAPRRWSEDGPDLRRARLRRRGARRPRRGGRGRTDGHQAGGAQGDRGGRRARGRDRDEHLFTVGRRDGVGAGASRAVRGDALLQPGPSHAPGGGRDGGKRPIPARSRRSPPW